MLLAMLASTSAFALSEYKCEMRWTSGPEVSAGHFTGTLEDQCTVKTLNQAGFRHLFDVMEEELLLEVETFHGDAIEADYLGMPGLYYDVTLATGKPSNNVRVRGDQYLATDGMFRFSSGFFSNKISGSGPASYVRVSNVRVEVTRTLDPDRFASVFAYEVKVEKPVFLTQAAFLKRVKADTEDEASRRELRLVTAVANGT